MEGSEITLRATEQQFEASGGRSEILDKYDRPAPFGTEHVWEWFWQLNRGRTCGMGLNPITWPDIAAWSQLTGNHPRQWELDAITRIDSLFIAIHTPKPKPSKGKKHEH